MHQIDESASVYYWYVVHCKPRREGYTATALKQQLGLTVYVPEVKRQLRGQIQYTPLFPSYLFIYANPQNIQLNFVHAINTTPGVLRLVTLGGAPQPVPAAVIEALRKRLDGLNAQGGLLDHPFRSGDVVRLKDGPLQGLEAIFVGPMRPSERVHVLINFLGSLRDAEVNVDLLESANSPSALKRERRTRGRGRLIKNAHNVISA